MGFFDLHVCNWPKRPRFFLALFSTTRFDEIRRIQLLLPDGSRLGEINLDRYRVVQEKNKPEKRIFIAELDIPEQATHGWYRADQWDGGQLVYRSPLTTKTKITPPKNLFRAGGWYHWRVQARDSAGHILLGDFNAGSLSEAGEIMVQRKTTARNRRQ